MRVWATRRTPLFTSGEPLDRWLPPDPLPELRAESDFVVVASLNSRTGRPLGPLREGPAGRGPFST